MDRKPLVAITMGDGAGIGPEIILQALQALTPKTFDPLVVGDVRVFERAAHVLNSSLMVRRIEDPSQGQYRPGTVEVLDTAELPAASAPFGKLSPACGKASVGAIRRAHQVSKEYPVKALISAPMNKEAIHLAGFSYIDECALMSELTGALSPMMLLIAGKMRMATVPPLHVSLREACDQLSPQKVFEALRVLRASLISFGLENPTIGVAGLNPHGGEGGMFGREEIKAIIPGVEAGRKEGWEVRGPFPPDSFFARAVKGEFDGLLTMYHDQGRIAMKTTHFGKTIIVMIGIPVPFLTVAHGTAFDIAGQGKADPGNFIQVLQFADQIQRPA